MEQVFADFIRRQFPFLIFYSFDFGVLQLLGIKSRHFHNNAGNWQDFLEDGYYVKVLGERKTIFGTAWYQLNHASLRLELFVLMFPRGSVFGVIEN